MLFPILYLNYSYTLTYKNGTSFTTESMPVIDLSDEQYLRFVRAMKEDPSLEGREEIADIVEAMKEHAMVFHRLIHEETNPISRIHLFLPARELSRFQRYPLEFLSRPAEKMTVYGSKGSSVTISSQFGEVRISDGNSEKILDADQFISWITR